MPSIDNSFLSTKAPAKQERSKPLNEEGADVQAKKPFSQQLQDEIEKELKQPGLDKTAEKEENVTDKLQKEALLVSDNTEMVEESDILLSGNNLPVEAVIESAQVETDKPVAGIEKTLINPFILTEKVLQVAPVKTASSLSVALDATASIELEIDEITAELVPEFEVQDEPVIKIQKQIIDGQLNTKVELPINDVGKPLKVVQVSLASATSMPDIPKTPIDSLPVQSQIRTPVSNKQWGSELSQRVGLMLTNGQQVAELRLNPARLGSVSIRLQLDDDKASVSFVTQNQAVKEAIDVSLPRLREQLQQQGLELSHAQVDVEDKNNESAFEHSGFSQQGRAFNHGSGELEDGVQGTLTAVNVDAGLSVFV